METKRFDLENRLVKFACMCLDVCDLLPPTKTGQNLEYQLCKSATAPALIYGEAQAAESRADFIHKMKIALKELRETRINLRIIREKPVIIHDKVDKAFKEVNELIAIFASGMKLQKEIQGKRKRNVKSKISRQLKACSISLLLTFYIEYSTLDILHLLYTLIFIMLSLIVAASSNNAIGKSGQLLWNLPNDMKFFKDTTWGMPVIMGRKTFESLNKALPGRINIVITSRPRWQADNVITARNLEDAVQQAAATNAKEIFIIGGGEVFKQSMDIADKIYLTRVHANIEGDAFFPVIDETQWQMTGNVDFAADEKHAYAYSFQVWERRREM